MEFVLWKRDEFSKLYNCSFYDVDSVPLHRRQHVYIGISMVIMFFVFEVLYIPSLFIMKKPIFFKQSCYKIMFFMGVVDVACLIINAGATGMFAIAGEVYCSRPMLIYALGMGCLCKFILIFVSPFDLLNYYIQGCWVAQSDSGLILAFNRCLEMYDPIMCSKLFDGKRAYIWLLIPTFHAICFLFFTKPILFSGIYISWFLNPHIGYHDDSNFVVSRF